MSNLDTLLLSADQRERYRALLAERRLADPGGQGIAPRAPGQRIPLTSYQEPLWFIDRYEGGDTAHNVVYPMGLPEEEIDEPALLQAIGRMIERHEILRTTFRQDDAGAVQIVHESWPPALERVDLRPLPDALKEATGWKLVDKEAAHQFDLEQGPLIRFTLLIVAPNKNVLIVSLHHIVCDTWSVAIIDREIRTHYDDIVNGRPCSLPPVAAQFGDYAIWQREQIARGAHAQHVDYWVERLAEAPPLQLETDFPAPERRSHRAANSLVLIEPDLLEKVNAYARSHGVTLYMVLLSAFKIMLARHTGQSDIVVGTPHANRELDVMRDVIGFTINSLALRTELDGNPTFEDAVRRVSTSALQAYEHQAAPFQSVVEALGVRGKGERLSRYSLLRVFFSVQNIKWADIGLPQINTGKLHDKPRFTVPHPTTKYDIYMYLRERDGKVLGGVEYDTELFAPSRIERMIRHFLRILEQGVTNPGTAIHALAMLSEDEVRALCPAPRPGPRDAEPPAAIHAWFERMATRWADRPALIDGERVVTYQALADASARLAGVAPLAGLAPEQRVGLLADRSIPMVETVLAVLRAGGVCAMLDHSAPALRIGDAVRAHGIVTLLCDPLPEAAGNLPGDAITLDALAARACAAPAPGARRVCAEQTAFVFMTSGSTGVPNAVELTHAGVLNGQLPQTCPHPIGPGDRLLMTAPTSSARLVGELLWPLLNGATVVMCRPGGHQDPVYLGELLQQQRITHFSVLPQVLTALLDDRVLARCPDLKLVYCVGQSLEQQLAARFVAMSGATLYNSYAQTEACPVTFHPCDGAADAGLAPVGRVAPHTAVYVLDAYLRPVPTGVTGQIAIAGDLLARGYMGNPRLTAEKFVPNPFGAPGSRMYRSGDLGSWDEEARLALRGRSDQRVKIRGYRIDLGEIEHALMSIDGVDEAAAVVSSDLRGEPAIAAFIRARPLPVEQRKGIAQLLKARFPVRRKDVQAPLADQLRAILQARLPFYMVPARITQLDALPRGRTGKVDRVALAAYGAGPAAPTSTPEGAPRTEHERVLVAIWRDVLDLPADRPFGIYDSFFELGGHSLSAVKIVRRIQAELNVKLDIRNVFEAVTIAGLGDLIEWTVGADSFDDVEL
ncbi:AMP-binding enzyme family protein [Burkholderia thailandensis MSMB121]|uniref:non-ribosomal peptide synthetase n=1 Tax=Burkholderia humptydooensis TaxID=430531 RepID=UPI00032805DC|nr:condensation domain-containing protein [Burkholderia humptydooensis]AGK49934.1 AMP-binding enzyme family protein [Burkholderia thailandensis MSMB121]ATF33243.1 thioester reductase [Burkholderia thailandensis]KST71328.1 thioester reductase [Burkholderia humptydooensis]